MIPPHMSFTSRSDMNQCWNEWMCCLSLWYSDIGWIKRAKVFPSGSFRVKGFLIFVCLYGASPVWNHPCAFWTFLSAAPTIWLQPISSNWMENTCLFHSNHVVATQFPGFCDWNFIITRGRTATLIVSLALNSPQFLGVLFGFFFPLPKIDFRYLPQSDCL